MNRHIILSNDMYALAEKKYTCTVEMGMNPKD